LLLWVSARLGVLNRRVLLATTLVLAVGECITLLIVLHSGGGSHGPVAHDPPREARFLAGIVHVCDAVNRGNRQAVHQNSTLQEDLDRADTPNQAVEAVLTAVGTQVNAATDTAVLLASVAPPGMAREDYDTANKALDRNLARLRQYMSGLEKAKTPEEVRLVLHQARDQEHQIAADRETIRSALIAIGGGDCALDHTPTLPLVFPPAFYAGSPQSPAAHQSDQQIPDQSPQTVVPPPPGGSGPPNGGSGAGIIDVLSAALAHSGRIPVPLPCGVPT
jgi:hypothetical protein